MSHRHQHTTSYPPPLFVAELDTAPIHGSVTAPEGGLAFEMPAEAAPTRIKDEQDERPARTAEVGDTLQANPWPFYLDQDVKTYRPSYEQNGDSRNGSQEEKLAEAEQANPWPYHGPVFGHDENGPSATIYPTAQKQGGLSANVNGLVGKVDALNLGTTAGAAENAAKAASDEPVSSPGNILDPKSPTSLIKPYSPPPDRHDIAAGGLGSPTSACPKSPTLASHGHTAPYRPYRPPSISLPGAGTPASPSQSNFYVPFGPGSQPASPPSLKEPVAAEPTTVSGTAHVNIKPYSPTSPTFSPRVDETLKLDTVSSASPPLSKPAPASATAPLSSPPPVSPPSQQPLAHLNSSQKESQIPVTAQTSPGLTTLSPKPIHLGHPPQVPPSPALPNNVHQQTYTPSPHPSPQPTQQRPHIHHANSTPAQPPSSASASPGYSPYSPPPAYSFPHETRPGSQPPPVSYQHQHPLQYHYQYPPYSLPPPSPYPPQPVYANNVPPIPPLPPGKPPPPLPPRRPQPQHGGFGGDPINTTAYPLPPKTHYNPVTPAFPPRPGSSSTSSGSLFSSASAKKWFDKTSQVLESKLESVLQGSSGPYRPAYASNAPVRHNTGAQGGVPGGYGYGPAPGPGAGTGGSGQWGQGPPAGWRGP